MASKLKLSSLVSDMERVREDNPEPRHSVNRAPRKLAGRSLEPRILLDAAAVETLDQAAEAVPDGYDNAEPDSQLVDEMIKALDSRRVAEGSADQLVVVDESVVGWRDIVDQLSGKISVEVIQSGEDGMAQLADIASRYDDLQGMHLISHGADGTIRLGGTSVSQGDLQLYQDALTTTGNALAEGGDFFLYGCNVAGSPEGQAFVDALGRAMGADVAASDDLTGGDIADGDWLLEYQYGDVDQSEALSLVYSGSLAWTDTGIEGGMATGDGVGQNVAVDGPWLVAGNDTNEVVIYRIEGDARVPVQVINTAGADVTNVDIDGDFMILGDRAAQTAELYEFDGTSWVHNNTFADRYNNDSRTYGWDVAVQDMGNTVNVGVTTRDPSGGGDGASDAFTSNDGGTSWSLVGSATTTGNYGHSVAMAGNYMLIGQPDAGNGNVYLRDMTNWGAGPTTYTNLYNDNAGSNDGLTSGDYRFGFSVAGDYDATSGNAYWAAGGPDYYRHRYNLGFSTNDRYGYVAIFQNTTHTATIGGTDIVGGDDKFGHSLDITTRPGGGDANLLVGAPLGNGGDGWAFRFDNVINAGQIGAADQTFQHTAGSGENLGRSVGISEYALAIGAPLADLEASDGTITADVGIIWNWLDYGGAPTAVDDTVTTDEETTVNVDWYPNDTVSPSLTFNPVTIALIPDGRGGEATVSYPTYQEDGSAEPIISFNPNGEFDYLGAGEDLITNSADGNGTIKITYSLTDSFGNTTADPQAVISVNVTGVNDAPTVALGIPNLIHNAGTPVNYTIPSDAFADVDQNDSFTYTVTNVVEKTGATGDLLTVTDFTVSAGVLSYSPQLAHEGQRYTLTLEADDGNGGTITTQFDIDIARPNEAPTTVGDPGARIIWQGGDTPAGESSDFDGAGFDISPFFDDNDLHKADAKYDSEALEYSIIGDSHGLSVDVFSGMITGSPLNTDVGTHVITVQATDEFGESVTQTIDLTVYNVNDAPIVTNPVDDQDAYLTQDFSYFLPADFADDLDVPADSITLTATYSDGTPLDGTATGYPGVDWLRFDSATGEFYAAGGVVSGDNIGARIDLKVTATDESAETDDSAGQVNSGGIPDPKSTDYFFSINVFAPTETTTNQFGPTAGYDELGNDISLSENGQYQLIGAPASSGNNDAGAWRIHDFNGVTIASATTATTDGDRGGWSVDMSADGSRFIVSAPGFNNETGRVFLYTFDGNAATQVGTIDGALAGDQFGYSVEINDAGDRIIVGAPGDDGAGTNAGAAYIYNWSGTQLGATLTPSAQPGGMVDYARFGSSVAIDRNVAVVGAPWESLDGASYTGTARAFGLDSGGFNGNMVLLDRGADAQPYDLFGWSVDVDVFQGEGTSTLNSSAVIAVGAIQDDSFASDAGSVHTWRSDGLSSSVTQGELDSLLGTGYQGEVTAYDGVSGALFGHSVAVDVDGSLDQEAGNGLRMVVGGNINGDDVGGAYAYRWWDASGWVGQRYNGGAANMAGSQFGYATDLAGQRFVVGAPGASMLFSADTTGSLIESAPNSGLGSKFLGSEQFPVSGVTLPGIAPDWFALSADVGRGYLDDDDRGPGLMPRASFLDDLVPGDTDLDGLGVAGGVVRDGLFRDRTDDPLRADDEVPRDKNHPVETTAPEAESKAESREASPENGGENRQRSGDGEQSPAGKQAADSFSRQLDDISRLRMEAGDRFLEALADQTAVS